MELYWVTHTAAYWALVLFLVPAAYLRRLILFAFLGGFVYTWIVQLVAIDVLGLWYFHPDVLTLWKVPVFFVLSWFGVTLVYGYLLYKYPENQLWILIFFVLWATSMNIAAVRLDQVFLPHWSIPETFMFAVFSHVLLLYALKYMHKVEELGAKEYIVKLSLAVLKNK